MAGDTAQGNALGVLARVAKKVASLPTPGQHEPMNELRPVSEGDGTHIPRFPLPSGADDATTPECAYAANHADQSTDFAVQLPLF